MEHREDMELWEIIKEAQKSLDKNHTKKCLQFLIDAIHKINSWLDNFVD